MNENLADEIRKTIESIKDMKTQVSGINNYLSILEGMMRADIQKKVDDAYQKGYDKGYADKTNNDEVGKELAKDVYQKGFNDGKEYGLDESDMREAVSYQKGLDDAWAAARKLFSSMADSDIEKVFPTEWNNGGFNALMNLQPQEAIAKLKAYEEKQKADDEIKVGDEVIYNEHKFIVFATETEKYYASLFDVNGRHASADHREFKKTGRHFDIDKILEEMNE